MNARQELNSGDVNQVLSEQQVRKWVRYYLDPNLNNDDIDRLSEDLPHDDDLARWVNEKMGWNYGR